MARPASDDAGVEWTQSAGDEAVVECSCSNRVGGTRETKGFVSDEREESLIAGGGGPIHQEGTGGTPCGAQSVKGEVSTWTQPSDQ